jgi:hypothetical protein
MERFIPVGWVLIAFAGALASLLTLIVLCALRGLPIEVLVFVAGGGLVPWLAALVVLLVLAIRWELREWR